MQRFFGYSRYLDLGDPVPAATIEVFTAGTLSLATIYSDDLATPTPLANPFLADDEGFFHFYAADGRYDVRISGGPGADPIPTPYTWGDILLGRGDYILRGATTWNPLSIPDKGTESKDVTVAGALPGMPALASLSTIPSTTSTTNFLISAYVISTNTVRVVLYNASGSALDVSIGNLNVFVFNTKT